MKFIKNPARLLSLKKTTTKTSPVVGLRSSFFRLTFKPNLSNTNAQATKAKRKKWLIIMIFLLVIMPAALPSQASIFDPLLKILLPFYKGDEEEITIEEPLPTAAEAVATMPAQVNNQDLPPPYDGMSGRNDNLRLNPLDHHQPRTDFSTSELMASEPDLYMLLQAEFAADRGNMIQALQLYKAESFKKNATAVFERALELSLQNEPVTQSLDFAKQWSEQNPDHVPAWFYVAHLALKAQDYDTAATTLNHILTLDANADLTQILTGIFPRDFRSQSALFTALYGTDSDNNASLSVLKAGLLMQMNEPIPARLHAENALSLSPNNLAILTLKADILYNTGERVALSKFLAQARATTTGNTQKELYLYEIRHLIDDGNLPKAWQLLKVASQRFNQDHDLVLLASLVALDVGEYGAANERLHALILDPKFAGEAHYYLGVSYERTAQHGLALSHYRQVTSPELIWDATQKIVAYELLAGNPTQAIATLESLRQKSYEYIADSYILQADILLRQNQRDDAIALLNQAISDDPNSTELLYALSTLLGDDDPAKTTTLQALIALDPDNPSYQLAQARHLLALDPNDYGAISTAQSLSQLSRQDSSYNSEIQLQALQLLANDALAHQDYRRVISYLQTPYELKPDLNTGILLLRAYQGLGDMNTVNALLSDLQERFGNGDSTSEDDFFDMSEGEIAELGDTFDDNTISADGDIIMPNEQNTAIMTSP